VNDTTVPLSAREFLFYLAFARRSKQGDPPLRAFVDIENDMRQACEDYRNPDDFGHWSHEALNGFDATEDPRKLACAIRGKMGDAGFSKAQVGRLVPRQGSLTIELPPESIEIA